MVMMKKMFVQIAVFCLLATIAAVSAHEGHVHNHSPAPAPGPATNSAVVPTTNMFAGLAFSAVALVLGLNH
ncbi:arabinogalactan protein 24 [Raphanus sativus]|uniref:Arabinogalactan protein 24 n=1 Tax=Raphanus sativus TaxID=3726 RepID=A0A6J0NCH7_RAPSA|nr:arabinogalactan protein 24 [Raphanus sativus]